MQEYNISTAKMWAYNKESLGADIKIGGRKIGYFQIKSGIFCLVLSVIGIKFNIRFDY